MKKKRYAVVGCGGRSSFYILAFAEKYQDKVEMVGFCDTNQTRMNYYNEEIKKFNHPQVPTYMAEDFDKMISETKPDIVLVSSIDRTHNKYICRAMELGCDVVTEKPMTIDEKKCQEIIDTVNKTGKKLRVTFNCRYMPKNVRVKEVLNSGILGEITSVHFEWLLNTSHGADYFRRWHRNKANSGGLLIHKSSHHFDLVNWWLNSAPETIFAMGDLKFYGKINAEKRGIKNTYYRSSERNTNEEDLYAFDMEKDSVVDKLYKKAEHEDGYFRDLSVFSDGIDIEDNMSVMVRYKNNVVMNYTLCAHSPYEGFKIMFNGTKGRLEVNDFGESFEKVEFTPENLPFEMEKMDKDFKEVVPNIIFHPHWGKPYVISHEVGEGSHGGGDVRIIEDIVNEKETDPLDRVASYVEGANSVLIGIGANISMKTKNSVNVKDLVTF